MSPLLIYISRNLTSPAVVDEAGIWSGSRPPRPLDSPDGGRLVPTTPHGPYCVAGGWTGALIASREARYAEAVDGVALMVVGVL